MKPGSQGAGIVLVAAAAVAWSTAPLFVRLLPFDPFTILFWRGIFGGCSITLFLLLTQGRSGLMDLVTVNRGGLLVAGLSALGMVLYIPALQQTSVANVATINATLPLTAAALAWIWLKETPGARTLVASVMAFVGVAIMVGGISAASDLDGILLAAGMTLAIAGMVVAVRRYRDTWMVAAAALSNFLGSAVCLPFAQSAWSLSPNDMVILFGFGAVQVALGLTLFVIGSRFLPSAQASLISTLETPLMPFWIWLAFSEVPNGYQLIGGAVVLMAVTADTIGNLRARHARLS